MPKISDGAVKARPFRAIERADLDALPQLAALPADRGFRIDGGAAFDYAGFAVSGAGDGGDCGCQGTASL